MNAFPLPDRHQQPRCAADTTSTVPAEAGNVIFIDAPDFPEPEPDPDAWWPVTGREIATFWAIALAASAVVVTACTLAAGYACGMGTGDIIRTVLAWGNI